MSANDSLAAGTPPVYERLSPDAAFGTADRLLSRSLPVDTLARSPVSISVGLQGKPCSRGVSLPAIASSSVRHPAVDDSLSTASIDAGRRVAATADGPFGSVALPFGSLSALKRMEPIYQAMRQDDFLSCEAGCSDARASLKMVVGAVAHAGFVEKLDAVNNAVNHILAYRPDIESYGSNDHWATPQEALERRVGDCEDYAILKMAALERLGVPMRSMSLVVLRDQKRKLFHAVLAVRTSQGFFILDNLRPGVASDRAYPQYLALYAVSAGRGYIYGRAVPQSSAVASAAHLAGAAPGEGPGNEDGDSTADAGLFLEAALSADAVPID